MNNKNNTVTNWLASILIILAVAGVADATVTKHRIGRRGGQVKVDMNDGGFIGDTLFIPDLGSGVVPDACDNAWGNAVGRLDANQATWNQAATPRGTATLLIAASNAPAGVKARADYLCTGANDDVTIQAAINAMPATGGIFQFSEGTFSINAPVTMVSNVIYQGKGSATILLQTDKVQAALTATANFGQKNAVVNSVTGFKAGQVLYIYDSAQPAYPMDNPVDRWEGGHYHTIDSINEGTLTITFLNILAHTYTVARGATVFTSFNVLKGTSLSNVEIRDLIIDFGTTQAVASMLNVQNGIYFESCTNVRVTNVWVKNPPCCGVTTNVSTKRAVFRDIKVSDPGIDGIHVDEGNDITIDNCRINNCFQVGIAVFSTKSASIISNDINDSTHGIIALAVDDTLISGNRIYNMVGKANPTGGQNAYGIQLDNRPGEGATIHYGSSITNNTIDGITPYSGKQGFGIVSGNAYQYKVPVTGNTVRGMTHAIYINSPYWTITGNDLNCTSGGTLITGNNSAHNTIFSSNACYYSGYAIDAGSVNFLGNDCIITNNLINTNNTVPIVCREGSVVWGNVIPNSSTTVMNQLVEKWKNTSGGTLNCGNVVVRKSGTATNEYTTTTIAGDSNVIGIIEAWVNATPQAVANNGISGVLREGRTVCIDVNGTVDVAAGDWLATHTTAGQAAKAVAGQTVFARALAAQTADSNSLIAAVIVKPFTLSSGISNGGVASSVADAGTIAHGLGQTPTYAFVQGSDWGISCKVSALDATNITVEVLDCNENPTTATTVYWQAVKND